MNENLISWRIFYKFLNYYFKKHKKINFLFPVFTPYNLTINILDDDIKKTPIKVYKEDNKLYYDLNDLKNKIENSIKNNETIFINFIDYFWLNNNNLKEFLELVNKYKKQYKKIYIFWNFIVSWFNYKEFVNNFNIDAYVISLRKFLMTSVWWKIIINSDEVKKVYNEFKNSIKSRNITEFDFNEKDNLVRWIFNIWLHHYYNILNSYWIDSYKTLYNYVN